MRIATATILLAACAGRPVSPSVALDPALSSYEWSRVTAALDAAVAAGAAPGAVLAVSHRGARFVHGTGRLGEDDPTPPDGRTVYDLASLTKVVGLTTAVMRLVAEGTLELDAPAARYDPAFAGDDRAAVTIRHLLTHSSGLPAWRPLYKEAAAREEAFVLVETTPLEQPPGTKTVYSDLGAILLTRIVERVTGERIDTVIRRLVLEPLGMASTGFLPPAEWRARIAPTERDPWRGRVLRGEVHDENAARMDGVSGHAGLFGTAEDLLGFAEAMLAALQPKETGYGTASMARPPARAFPAPGPIVAEFVRRQDVVPGSSRALGWDTPSDGSSAGTLLSPSSFGHTGFTGTSIWIDPERELVIVLLSNRVHPTRENARWHPVRAQIADLVVRTLSEEPR